MLELVRYFNEHYGQEYENIEYPTTKKEIYQTYQIVKSYGIKDDKLVELLNEIVLPNPETIKEKEMYSECLYEVSGRYERKPFLKLTKDDFIYNEVKDMFYYKQNKLDWLNITEDVGKIGFKIEVQPLEVQPLEVVEDDSVNVKEFYITENNTRVDIMFEGEIPIMKYSNFKGFTLFVIANGVSFERLEEGIIAGSDFIIVLELPKSEFDNYSEIELELFKIEGNKISQDVLPYKLEFGTRENGNHGYLLVTINGRKERIFMADYSE